MKKPCHIVLFLFAISISSCYTYRIPKEYSKLENTDSKPIAYVINPSLKKELKILSGSQLFTITDDSVNANVRIKLYPLQRHAACGQGMTLSMVSVGQLPVVFRDGYFYQFDEIDNGKITPRKFQFAMEQRVWFWDMFRFNKRFGEKAGKMVLGNYPGI